ncbi:MAG: type I restriction-modification system subunit M [Isosphaeraceae bacterium]|nr:type I restriction-modification system subunit M [Isosphaeraceae bacterium]
MAIKKSELYASLWKSCDELRGGMDASQYKDYVLVLLFMKYVSDKGASRRDYLLDIPSGARFDDLVALKGQKDIGDGINKVIARLADANPTLRGAIDVANFNDPDKLGKGQEMVDRLTKLIGILQNPALDFRANTAEGDDLLGDAYEYLMRNFATESGKSKGQFYTPAEVSRVMAQVVGATRATSGQQSIYDPTCGSGSLLLKAHAAAKSTTGFDLAIYGQEMDNATAALARMNMVLHDAETAEIHQDNTLARPFWTLGPKRLKTFDFVVANPPFSTKSWTSGFDPEHDEYERFVYGLPPKKNGDYAFLLHMLASLKSTGRAAVILPHGVLFRGNAEAEIRRELVRRGLVEGVIGLPVNLFYGTGIPACVIVLDKAGASERRGIFMIDASLGFRKDGAKNRLRERDVHRIVDTFNRHLQVDRYSRSVSIAEIAEHDYNLNLPLYIDSTDPEDVQDIDGHLRGGVPARDIEALDAYWRVLPGLRRSLFQSAGRDGYSNLCVRPAQVSTAINDHPEFIAFRESISSVVASWSSGQTAFLRSVDLGARPKDVIATLSESILAAFSPIPLIDAYGVYQRVMDYADDGLEDDVYVVASEGWSEGSKPRIATDRKSKEGADFVLGRESYKSDLIPGNLVVSLFFEPDRAEIDRLTGQDLDLEQQLADLAEEHSVDGGMLEDAVDDSGKLTRRSVTDRLIEIRNDPDAADEHRLLDDALALIAAQARHRADAKKLTAALQTAVARKYGELTEGEIRELVVDNKWLGYIARAVDAETDRVARNLTLRVNELGRRYGRTLAAVRLEARFSSDQLDRDLAILGAKWADG